MKQSKSKIFAFSYQKQTAKEFRRGVCSLRKKPLKKKKNSKRTKNPIFIMITKFQQKVLILSKYIKLMKIEPIRPNGD